jgi:hypothetical protein
MTGSLIIKPLRLLRSTNETLLFYGEYVKYPSQVTSSIIFPLLVRKLLNK